jgi:hypothetical protein
MLRVFRIAASLFIVTLLIGVATDGMRAAAMTMAPQMSMSGDGGMPDCDGCDGDDASSAVCAIVCTPASGFAMGLPVVAAAKLACPAHAETGCMAFRIPAGMRAPPDPFPPKVLVLN